MTILDTSFLYALLNVSEMAHETAKEWYARFEGHLITTPLILTELDYLATRDGGTMRTAIIRHVEEGAYELRWWSDAAAQTASVAAQYRDLGASLVDASLVALAARLPTTEIATFDERHFRAMKPIRGGRAFRLLPADA